MKIFYVLLLVGFFGLTACREEGPAEQFGRELDEAATDAANAVEDACEDVLTAANSRNTNC